MQGQESGGGGGVGEQNGPETDYDGTTGLLPAAPSSPSSWMQTGEAPTRKVGLASWPRTPRTSLLIWLVTVLES